MKVRDGVLLRLLSYLKPHWRTVTVAVLLAFVASGAEALIAWLVKPAMDDIFLKRDLTMLKLVPLAVLGAYLLKGAGSYGQAYLMACVGQRIIARLRRELYVHIQGMPLSFFTSRHSGELMVRVVSDVDRIARITAFVFVHTIRQLAAIIALLVVMFARDWVLALLAASLFPVVGVVIRALGRQLYRTNRRAQERIGELSVLLHGSFTGIKIVKAFGREPFEQARFGGLNDRLLQLALKNARVDQLSGPLMETLGAFGLMGILWYAGVRVIGGTLTPGEFFSFIAAFVLFYNPVRWLSRAFNTVQQYQGSVERVFEILDIPPAIVDAPGAIVLDEFRDRIVFEHVSFRYAGAETDVLADVSMTLSRGETVALVGLSGAGKSTLMDLLLRFYDVTTGRITIDGHDLRQVAIASLRAQIAVVTQEIFLFRQTIEYNIAYGRPGATPEDIERAARQAQAHDFITALPQGYQMVVGERGVKLSAGQRQRIAIARAFLKNPPILILDEATSNLDAEREVLVHRALKALMTGRTVLVITHRLATVRNADRVAVVHGGRIVETGHHSELIARAGGLYHRLAALQVLDAAGN